MLALAPVRHRVGFSLPRIRTIPLVKGNIGHSGVGRMGVSAWEALCKAGEGQRRQCGHVPAQTMKSLKDIHAETLDVNKDKTELYKVWAPSYDAYVAGEDYAGPTVVATALAEALSQKSGPFTILDAGCGTGLVGEELFKHFHKEAVTLIGADISLDMMAIAKERDYAETVQVDFNTPTKFDHTFDGIVCSGTFISGHVHAEPALPDLVTSLRPGGILVATVRTSFYDDAFKSVVHALQKDGAEVEISTFQYLTGVTAELLKIRKPLL